MKLEGPIQIVRDFLNIFDHEIKTYNYFPIIEIKNPQRKTPSFVKKLNNFVKKYAPQDPKVHRLRKFFEKLDEGECFFVLSSEMVKKFSTKERFNAELFLAACSENRKFEDLIKEFAIFQGYLDSYDLKIYGNFEYEPNKLIKIGESDKTKRICRFCGKSYPQVTFRKKAHAISESLGNKYLILNEECDSCNEWFDKNIERDIINFLSIDRIFFNVKGKDGIPKLKGSNFQIKKIDEKTMRFEIVSDTDTKTDILQKGLEIRLPQKICFQNIYRALCKFFSSVVESEYLSYFAETIKWIKKEKDLSMLPKVGILPSYYFFTKHPWIVYYIRKGDNFDLPFAVGEFHFTWLTFVFIVPLCFKDKKDFTKEEDFNLFWNFFPQFKLTKGWKFYDFSDNMKRDFIFTIKFEKSIKKP